MEEVYSHLKEASLNLGSSARAEEMRAMVEEAFQKSAATPMPSKEKKDEKGGEKPKEKTKAPYPENRMMQFMQSVPQSLSSYHRREESMRTGVDSLYGDAAKWRTEQDRGAHPGGIAKLSPEEEAENMVRQRVFLNLMHNDEILSKADPSSLATHYNTLVRIAPEVSLVPEAARSFLRNMVHSGGGIDMFTVEQAGKATGALQKAKIPGEVSANPGMKDIREKQMSGAR